MVMHRTSFELCCIQSEVLSTRTDMVTPVLVKMDAHKFIRDLPPQTMVAAVPDSPSPVPQSRWLSRQGWGIMQLLRKPALLPGSRETLESTSLSSTLPVSPSPACISHIVCAHTHNILRIKAPRNSGPGPGELRTNPAVTVSGVSPAETLCTLAQSLKHHC